MFRSCRWWYQSCIGQNIYSWNLQGENLSIGRGQETFFSQLIWQLFTSFPARSPQTGRPSAVKGNSPDGGRRTRSGEKVEEINWPTLDWIGSSHSAAAFWTFGGEIHFHHWDWDCGKWGDDDESPWVDFRQLTAAPSPLSLFLKLFSVPYSLGRRQQGRRFDCWTAYRVITDQLIMYKSCLQHCC